MVKKQLIMEKSLELFARQGFEATSVQQITEHCGISKGAFYLSFKSKDELILALIDHFMSQLTSDIDYTVKQTNNSELLYKFYYTTFETFHKHSDFAKVLIKEQTQSFNEELLSKFHYYDKLSESIILEMLERLYGDMVKQTKYDLIYCVKGFMSMYSHLFLFYNIPLDLERLSQSLVEKTNLLARHTTIPFISQDLVRLVRQPLNEELSGEQMVDLIEAKLDEIEDPIVVESLVLLKQEVLSPSLSRAIIKGLLENIRNHPHCKWIAFLMQHYFQL
jgi:AcrR family transcriptional regulator